MDQVSPAKILYYTQIGKATATLTASNHLGLFDYISEKGSASVEDIAQDLQLDNRGVDGIVITLAAMELLIVNEEKQYSLTDASERYLVSTGEDYLGWFIQLNYENYTTPASLVAAVKTGEPQVYGAHDLWAVHGDEFEKCKTFTKAMYSISKFPASVLPKYVDFSQYSTFLDVAGGSGIYCIEAAKQNSELRTILMDIPGACAAAQEIIDDCKDPIQDRVNVMIGDMFSLEAYPAEFDIALLSHIVHDWSYDNNVALMRNIYTKLPKGGSLLIMENIINEERDGPMISALMYIQMLIWCEGKQCTVGEVTCMLVDAGFSAENIESKSVEQMWTCIIATK